MEKSRITRWLSKTNSWIFNLYTVWAAFMTYSCMYAFRKPFAVATFEEAQFIGIDLKIWLITAQLTGYALSKFIGIKVISELKGATRTLLILILIGIAEIALLGFALADDPWNILFLFCNGIPLGLVWGIVFSYLEGRKSTEFLGAGLCVSFIFSSGLVKSVGKWLMINFQVTEYWMPFYTGAIFIIPLLIAVYLLGQVPPPTAEDIQMRTERKPMNRQERWRFFLKFAAPLILLIVVYMFLTIFRDFRDNFSAEMWQSMGYGDSSAVFTLTEIPISITVLIVIFLVMFVKNNKAALFVNHFIVFFGLLVVGISTLAYEMQALKGEYWMVLVGLGLYLGYVPFNSIFFDRMIASFRYVANVGFLIYLADSFGYLASVAVMLYKNFGQPEVKWLNFFVTGAYLLAFIGMSLVVLSMIFFQFKFASVQNSDKEVRVSFQRKNLYRS
ncbi:MAG: DUF5690 family protein [Cytophagales bacterium]|nr:DUF5690 family protein [Cytophagales bacterium]